MKFAIRVGVIITLVLLTVSTVSAHAKLVRANPAPNSISTSAPSQLQLWFDEPLELNFSSVQVLDAQGQRVDTRELAPVTGDPNSVIVPLKLTGDGTYNVIWKVLSAADGHITNGVFAFGVGNIGSVAAPMGASQVAAPNELTPFAAVVRWLSLLALLVLSGGFIFRFFILVPSLDDIHADNAARQLVHKRWAQLTVLALILFFVGNLSELVLQTNLVTDQIALNSITNILFSTRFGMLWLMRVGLIVLCTVLVGLEARGIHVPYRDYALIVLGNVALFTRSLNSHAASAGNFSLPVFADWLHLVAIAVWAGGLVYFAWLMPFVWRVLSAPARSKWIAQFIPQFSSIAIGATVVIAVTGLYNSAQQIPALDILSTGALPSLDALWNGVYTSALDLKVALFLVMIAFGAMNLLWLSPRFRRSITVPEKSARLFSRFRLTVGAEVLLGLAAIFLAGILTLSPPPRSTPEQFAAAETQPRTSRPVALLGYPSSDVKVQLEIGPNPGAPTIFTARVTDAADQALSDIQRVIFQFMYLNQDVGAQNVNADARADNQYVAEGQYLPLDGMWKIQVRVRRKGVDDVTVEFPYYIAPRVPKTDTTPDPTAQAELLRAQQAMNALTALRSTQALNDGASNIAISDYEYQAPDKTRFRVQGQGESIAIGGLQYYPDAQGNWTERPRVEPFVFPRFDFADTAQATQRGRADKIASQPAQIILFATPTTSGQELIHYAYWIGADGRVLQLGMVAESHYMLQSYRDFNSSEIEIRAPANALPAPTVAPVSGGDAAPLTSAVQGSGRPRGLITGDLEGDGALVLVVAGVVILLVGAGGKRTRQARLVTLGTGAAAVLLGIGLFIDAVNGTTAAIQNAPVNTTRASSGQQIYEQNCATCHGEKGYGDGPTGVKLPVKPFDLTTHVLLHDEQYLHAVILNGRGYMPAWGNKLSQDQILDVIAYARLLARNAQQASPNATPARPGFTPQP